MYTYTCACSSKAILTHTRIEKKHHISFQGNNTFNDPVIY